MDSSQEKKCDPGGITSLMSTWTLAAAVVWAMAGLRDADPEAGFMALLLCVIAVILQGYEDATK